MIGLPDLSWSLCLCVRAFLLFTAALRSMQTAGELEVSRLSKPRYVEMLKKMYRAMIDDYDEDDALECAEEDWERDARGEATLGRELFCDALFECVQRQPHLFARCQGAP